MRQATIDDLSLQNNPNLVRLIGLKRSRLHQAASRFNYLKQTTVGKQLCLELLHRIGASQPASIETNVWSRHKPLKG
jgi:hypothetical protein